MKPNIAFIGKARAGKDTAGAHLVQRYRYTRLAFADPLKEMALAVDPLIPLSQGVYGRLSDLVLGVGWEYAKDKYPEVRRLLQRMGQAQRERDSDYWVSIALRSIAGAAKLNMPVVVTDCRYRNEALALREAGFLLVRLTRPGTGGDSHHSETELDDFAADINLPNAGTRSELYADLDGIVAYYA